MKDYTPKHGCRVSFLWALVGVAGIALASCQPVYAQSTLPIPPCEDRAPLPLPTAVAPAGVPKQIGGTCEVLVEHNLVGVAAALLCVQAGTPVSLSLYAVRHTSVTPAMVVDFLTLGLPGDNRERIRAIQAKYQDTNVWDMCDVWGPMRERINSRAVDLTPVVGPLPTWVVAKYAFQPTRPTFYIEPSTPPAIPGPVLISATGRATVGTSCDCTKTSIVVSRVQYCAFQGGIVNYQFTPVTACVRP